MSSRQSTRPTGKPAEPQSVGNRPRHRRTANRSIVVKGTTMGRINTFRASGEAERADPSDETVINGAPYDAPQAIRSGAENPAAPVDRPDAHMAEEIKRRQVLLAMRYVAALRAH
jgi:hypothetical protein